MSSFRCDRPDGSDPRSAATIRRTGLVVGSLAGCLIVFAAAQAQQQLQGSGAEAQPQPPAAEAPPPSTRPGFFDSVGRWFGDSKAAIDSQFRSTQETLGTFGNQAKDAAGSVVAIPGTRIITGRQLCPSASNGAPDCQQGVDSLCRAKGFQSGRTLEVASAHRCSVRGLISGRAQKEGPCPVETYVTRAVCQ
jgi:hypothetical protein